jgi:methyl-accepting chemotaxis protein
MIITTILVFLAIFASILIARKMSKQIADPITYCAERIKSLSEGDLKTEIIHTDREDEIGLLVKSLSSTVKGLNNVVSDISYHLGALENGDYTTEVTLDYLGDFDSIEWSLKGIIKSLNNTMKQIDESAEQVASGSEQVSAGSQALSQGATEQASSIEELAATVNEITEQINETAKNAENAKEATSDAVFEIKLFDERNVEMGKAMNEITETSSQIGKIIKTIEDIAFQTNILALNAAVEAARAGSAGKGFAVVADEVRNLASKSAEAAKNTTQLIENSLRAVDNGRKISEKTEESLKSIVNKSNTAFKLVEEIASAAEQQAIGASQITIGIEQISSVVQNNSATAEESAAASEELNSQAQMLKNLVENIKLKDNIFSTNEGNGKA